jgi:hypothetical protein
MRREFLRTASVSKTDRVTGCWTKFYYNDESRRMRLKGQVAGMRKIGNHTKFLSENLKRRDRSGGLCVTANFKEIVGALGKNFIFIKGG